MRKQEMGQRVEGNTRTYKNKSECELRDAIRLRIDPFFPWEYFCIASQPILRTCSSFLCLDMSADSPPIPLDQREGSGFPYLPTPHTPRDVLREPTPWFNCHLPDLSLQFPLFPTSPPRRCHLLNLNYNCPQPLHPTPPPLLREMYVPQK